MPHSNFFWLSPVKRLAIVVIFILLAYGLVACQSYDGYPVATPAPTQPAATAKAAPPTARPTLPPPPTFAPRPTLPPTPAGVQPQKAAIIKEGFDALLNNYFLSLDSADIYEVGLRAIEVGLEQAGITNPEVPIPNFGTQADANWNTFLQAYTIVLSKYKGQISEDNLAQAALSGALSSAQDCQTGFIPANQSDSYLSQRLGQQAFVGIGINLQSGTGNGRNVHIVSRVIPGGPAERAGLKTGDLITGVDGQETGSKTNVQVVQLLQGQARGDAANGTKVTLGVQRGTQTQNVDILRAKVQQRFVERQVLAGNVGYLRFNSFPFMDQTNLDTNQKLVEGYLAEFNKANVTGIVIDLRNNSAGSINIVQTFLSYFLPDPELEYLTGGRTDQNQQRQYGIFPMPRNDKVQPTDKPLSVLVDGGTGAEAEIFAHAIQRAKRGSIVGETTAGCVNASSPTVLKDNSVVNVSVYRVVADPDQPDNLVTEVTPDQAASVDLQQLSQGVDTQLQAAIKALTK